MPDKLDKRDGFFISLFWGEACQCAFADCLSMCENLKGIA